MSTLANETRGSLCWTPGQLTVWFQSAQTSAHTQNRDFMFKLFAKNLNSQSTYTPALLGRVLLGSGQNSDRTCANNVTSPMPANQSLRLVPDPLKSASTDVGLASRYQLSESFVCWEHIEYEKALPTMLGLQAFLLLSKYSYNCEFSALPWSAPNIYPAVMPGKWEAFWSFMPKCNFGSKIMHYNSILVFSACSWKLWSDKNQCPIVQWFLFACFFVRWRENIHLLSCLKCII